METGDWISLVSAVTALVAVLTSPYVALRVARQHTETARHQIETTALANDRQIRASVVSANRQAWINQLRDTIAEFQARVATIGTNVDLSEVPMSEVHERVAQVTILKNKITLLINPSKPDQARLASLADEILSGLRQTDEKSLDVARHAQDDMRALAQKVLKQEWERVKRGE